jgi:hypothetical protein
MKFDVRTPVADFTGVVGSVGFAMGRAIVDSDTHPAELAYFRTAGYHVSEIAPSPVWALSEVRESLGLSPEQVMDMRAADETAKTETPKPRRNGSAEAWRAYAIAQGVSPDEANTLTRDQLAERFADPDEETSQ